MIELFCARGCAEGNLVFLCLHLVRVNGRGRELTSSSLSGQTADDADDAVGHKSFISATVQTGFCEWSAKYFAQPVMKVTRGCLCVLSSRVLQLLTRAGAPSAAPCLSLLFFLQSGKGNEWSCFHHAALGSCTTAVLVKSEGGKSGGAGELVTVECH